MTGSGETDWRRHARLAATQWVVGLCEPLVPARSKLSAEQRMAGLLAGGAPVWATAFCSAFLYGITVALPSDDPWRRLRFRVEDGPARRPVGGGEGAWRVDGSVFGTARDVTDIVATYVPAHPETDFITAGSRLTVPGWFTPAAAALVGAAGVSARTCFQALAAQRANRTVEVAFDDVIRATSAVLHRRRAYQGNPVPGGQSGSDDTLPMHLAGSLGFAERITEHLGPSELASASVAERVAGITAFDEFRCLAAAVPDDLYEIMRIDLGDPGPNVPDR